MIGGIVLIEIASCQNRNAPSLEITGRNVVAWGRRPLVHRQHLAISARIKRRVSAAGQQRNITAGSDILKTWNRSHEASKCSTKRCRVPRSEYCVVGKVTKPIQTFLYW